MLDGECEHVAGCLHAAGVAVVRKAVTVLEAEPRGHAIARVGRRDIDPRALRLPIAAESLAIGVPRSHADDHEAAVAGLAGRIVADRIIGPGDDVGRVAAARDDQVRRPVGALEARQALVVLARARSGESPIWNPNGSARSVNALNCPTTSGTNHEAGRCACAGAAAPNNRGQGKL